MSRPSSPGLVDNPPATSPGQTSAAGSASVGKQTELAADTRHDPTYLSAGRWGRWCECACGWRSRNGTVALAQLKFGQHLLGLHKDSQ